MRITMLPDGQILSMADILSIRLNFDLIPIATFVEFTVQSKGDKDDLFAEGKEFLIADIDKKFKIIQSKPLKTQTIKNGNRIGAIACLAVLSGCESLVKRTSKAIYLDGTSFNASLKALGVKVSLGDNVPLSKFICLKGSMPTERLALYLQLEASVMCFINGRLSVKKVDSFFKQDVKMKLDPSAVSWVNSEILEKLQKCSFVSTDEDGTTIIGDTDVTPNQKIVQMANLTARELRNLEKVLITRGTIYRPMNIDLRAGDLLEIGQNKYVILTAAHVFNSGALGGASSTTTKLWIASL